jgi:hypothetical protein
VVILFLLVIAVPLAVVAAGLIAGLPWLVPLGMGMGLGVILCLLVLRFASA